MSLLLNDYPPTFIKRQFDRFLTTNNANQLSMELNNSLYQSLHTNVLNRPTNREQNLNKVLNDSAYLPSILQQRPWNRDIMYVKYPYYSRYSATFRHDFKAWWEKHYLKTKSTLTNVQVKMISNTLATLENNFLHKKPTKTILRSNTYKTTAAWNLTDWQKFHCKTFLYYCICHFRLTFE